jgi:hypothetical protein
MIGLLQTIFCYLFHSFNWRPDKLGRHNYSFCEKCGKVRNDGYSL